MKRTETKSIEKSWLNFAARSTLINALLALADTAERFNVDLTIVYPF